MNLSSKIKIFFVLWLLILSNTSCRKDYQHVPYVPVNIKIDLHSHLTFMGIGETIMIIPDEDNFGVIHFNDDNRNDINLTSKVYGYGIILYRYDQEAFLAYDRTCTFQPETEYCALEFDDSGILPTCPCCSSRFIVSYAGEATGYPTTDSQAALALKQYRSIVANGWLTITNYK